MTAARPALLIVSTCMWQQFKTFHGDDNSRYMPSFYALCPHGLGNTSMEWRGIDLGFLDITSYALQEARVRFAGFGKEEDEWVNVRKGIRERSIPLEPSECHRINTGDLVLCFQERLNQAVYCDAHIMEIQRKPHDASSCTCDFIVRYDHDFSQEEVELSRLCCRPRQEESPQLSEENQYETALSISARSLWE